MPVVTYIMRYPHEFKGTSCTLTEKVVPVKTSSRKIPVNSEAFESQYIC
jgi:hypothetical protein